MVNGQTVSLKAILWNVFNHPLANDLTYDIAAGFAVEAIRLLGAPLAFINKVTDPYIVTVNHKAALPDDLLKINGVRLIQNDEFPERSAKALRYATDVYHHSKLKNTLEEFTYTIQNGIIYTSFPEACIEISYEALPVDEEGYPLIPNNQKVKLAIEYYILFRYLAPLYDIGKITDKSFGRIEQQKLFYMGAASNDMKLQGIDQLESVMNAVNRLIVNSNAHKNFFKNAGEKERFKQHR
jgi:hypothetical protein